MKQKTLSPLKWLMCILLSAGLMCGSLAFAAYLYDPCCYYRIPEKRLIVNNFRFVNAGIAKNADYDTAIIGSSMTQNFNMDSFRQKLNLNPVKLTVGGMSVQGTELTYSQVKRIGKAKTIITNIDLPLLNTADDNLTTYPVYLYDENPINDIKYLLGYETWMKLIPFNMQYNRMERSGEDIPNVYATHNIDRIGEWYTNAEFGKELLKKAYTSGARQVAEQNLDSIIERMKSNSDKLINCLLNGSEDKQFIVFFPPYSALYWYQAQAQQYFDEFLEVKQYIIDELSKYSNVTVYDFQCAPFITDLDLYKDVSHYNQDINEWMVDQMAAKEYIVNADSSKQSNEKLREIIAQFAKDNSDWL